MGASGGGFQAEAAFGPRHPAVEAFVRRARSLTDEERVALAAARRALAEDHREAALRAAAEALAGRSDAYARARRELSDAHVPRRLARGDGEAADHETSRLVQLAIDELLVALITSDVLLPDYLRELARPWLDSGVGTE